MSETFNNKFRLRSPIRTDILKESIPSKCKRSKYDNATTWQLLAKRKPYTTCPREYKTSLGSTVTHQAKLIHLRTFILFGSNKK